MAKLICEIGCDLRRLPDIVRRIVEAMIDYNSELKRLEYVQEGSTP